MYLEQKIINSKPKIKSVCTVFGSEFVFILTEFELDCYVYIGVNILLT